MARRNFLAYFFLTSCLVSGQSPRYVLKGQKVTLVTKGITGQPDNILWTHDGNKVVEFNGREEHVYDPYKTRVTLDWLSAELDISDLRLEDSGKYELEVSVNKKLEKSYHDMEVLDRVAKPTISCNISNSDNSGTLVCSAEPRQPVHLMTFEWHSQGSVHPGPHLQISLGGKLDDQVYNCTVRNPLTTETAAFTAKDCHTTKSSSVAPIAIAVFISVLLLIIGAGIFYYYKKQKGCFAKRRTDVENQKTYIRNGAGGTVETDEATPFIDGKSSSGKSSVGADKVNRGAAETEHLSESADKETQQDESNSTAAAGRDKNQHQLSDDSSIHKDSDGLQLYESAEEETQQDAGDPEPNNESDNGHNVVLSEHKSSTASDGSGSDKNEHQPSDDSSVDEDSDGQQLYESAEEEKQQDAGDPEPNDESDNGHKVLLSEHKSSTASDGSVSDQKRPDQQNTETSSSVTPPDAGSNNNQHQPSDDSSVHEDSDGHQLYEPADKETQSPGDPEPNDESDNGHKVVLSGRKSSTASDGSVSDQKRPDQQNTETSSSVTPPDAGSNKNQHQPSDDSSVDEDSDGQQLYEPAEEEKQQDAGDPEPNDESDQKISDHPKAEASSPSVTLPDAGQTKDDVNNKNTPVEERLSEGSDKQEGHASNKSESADVNQDPVPPYHNDPGKRRRRLDWFKRVCQR